MRGGAAILSAYRIIKTKEFADVPRPRPKARATTLFIAPNERFQVDGGTQLALHPL